MARGKRKGSLGRGRRGKGKGRGRRRVVEDRIVVRLMGEGQYYIDRELLKEINAIDNKMVRLLESDASVDDYMVRESIAAMRMLVKGKGKRVKEDVIIPSHIIIPTSDITVEEARDTFKGEGIIPEGMLD